MKRHGGGSGKVHKALTDGSSFVGKTGPIVYFTRDLDQCIVHIEADIDPTTTTSLITVAGRASSDAEWLIEAVYNESFSWTQDPETSRWILTARQRAWPEMQVTASVAGVTPEVKHNVWLVE